MTLKVVIAQCDVHKGRGFVSIGLGEQNFRRFGVPAFSQLEKCQLEMGFEK